MDGKICMHGSLQNVKQATPVWSSPWSFVSCCGALQAEQLFTPETGRF